MILQVALLSAVLIVASVVTGYLRAYALRRRLVDVPNVRSSHSVPTPRGGGVAIAVATLAALPVLGFLDLLTWREVTGMGGGGLLIVTVGFADDHASVPAHWRLLGHFVAALWMLAAFGGLPPLPAFGRAVALGLIGDILTMVYIVWMINLTNFMDGIDGIASVETVTVSLAGMCLCVAASCVASPVAGVLAAATLGFLIWNWPPAKIFMGDAGSGFLGGMLAVLSLQAARTSPALFWGWVILLGVFVVDATITLLRRMVRGEPVHEAHRSHAYQRAAIRYGGHRPVTLAIGAINLCWLFPLAWLVAAGQLDGLAAVLVAYAPLVALTVWLDAGGPATT